jgi:hypothetical protein
MATFLRLIPVAFMVALAVPLLAADRYTVPPATVETFTAADAPTYQGDGEWTIPWGYNRPENAQRTYPLVVIGRHNESRYFTTAIRKSYPAFYFNRTDLSISMNNEGDGQEVADIIDARMASHGYRIDTARMYMTGWSAGGNTTYRIANGLSSRGKCFAALIRLAGQETLTLAPATNGRISVWYHIGLLDTSNNRIPVARGHYDSIKNNPANAGAVETTVVNDNLIGLGQLEVLAGGGYGEWFYDPATFGGHGRQTTKSLTIDGVPFARLSEYDIQGHETEMAYADPGLYAWLFARGIGSGPSGPIGLSVSSLSVPEGATATFTVALRAQPAATTTVTVARTDGDASITVGSGATLTFTTANWSTPQTVTLAAAQDGDTAKGTATITVSAAGLGSRTLCAIEADDDTFGIALGNNALSVREGTTATVAVSLSAQPLANTTVTIQPGSGDADLSISGATTRTYTPANWQIPQYFTIVAAQDPDTVNGTRNCNLYISGTSINKTLLVSELDDDAVGLVMDTAALSVREGSTATCTVALSAQPAATTTVNVARTAGDADITVSSGSSLTFTTTNWSTPQTVTIAAAQDADLLNGTATITISAAGLTSRTLAVIEVDDDAGSVSNTAPTISAIADQNVAHNTATGALAFTIGDAETSAGSLIVTRASSNPTLVPVANIVLVGSAANRTVTVTPATGQSGTATITITVSDGNLSASDSFVLTVNAAPNTAPVVNAGADATITLPAMANLVGSATDDGQPTGSTLTYAWAKVSGPGTVSFAAPTSAVTTASFSAAGTYALRLSVSDGILQASDELSVTVDAAPSGDDSWLTLTADMLSYEQGQTAIPLANLVNEQALLTQNPADGGTAPAATSYWGPSYGAIPTFILNLGQSQRLQQVAIHDGWGMAGLTVTYWDGTTWAPLLTWNMGYAKRWRVVDVDVTTDRLRFAFDALGGSIGELGIKTAPSDTVNIAPFAKAGADAAITLPAMVSLSGSATDDGLPSGSALTYTWSKVSGPGAVSFAASGSAVTTASLSMAGTYVLQLTVSDGHLTGTDTVTILVAPANTTPVVNAGADATITLPAMASLSGSATDDGLPTGSTLTYAWAKVSGPGTVSFAAPTSAVTTATFAVAGTYVLQLEASDGVLTGTDMVSVTAAAETAWAVGYGTGIAYKIDGATLLPTGETIDLMAAYNSRGKWYYNSRAYPRDIDIHGDFIYIIDSGYGNNIIMLNKADWSFFARLDVKAVANGNITDIVSGIAVDGNNIYVAARNQKSYRYSRSGPVITFIGFIDLSAQIIDMGRPVSIAVGRNGKIHIIDNARKNVFIYSSDWTYERFVDVGSKNTGLFNPYSLRQRADGSWVISDIQQSGSNCLNYYDDAFSFQGYVDNATADNTIEGVAFTTDPSVDPVPVAPSGNG